MALDKEDYLEPVCVLSGQPGEAEPVHPVPIGRIMAKIRQDEDRNDWAAVEKHLLYWLAEAEANRDSRGLLTLHNELMGYYRKQGKQEPAFRHAEAADSLLRKLSMEETVTAGTTWVNIGTVREAFGDPDAALRFFTQARENYEKNLPSGDGRLGGLYNNMGLCLASLGRYADCREMYRKALDVMASQPNGELEQAITWLNLADALYAELGPEESEKQIEECLDRAAALLDTESLPRDGYYAFVCEKCAPVFGHYGWFVTEAELLKRAGAGRE